MRSASAVLFTLASSAFAYTITSPGGGTGWTNEGTQLITWTRDNDDAQNFTVVLQNPTATPPITFVLAALVDGTLMPAEFWASPPSGGWPMGQDFQVMLVDKPDNLTGIFATSQDFDINEPDSSASSSSRPPPTSSSFVITPTNTGIIPNTPNTNGGDDDSGAIISIASIGLTSIFALAALFIA